MNNAPLVSIIIRTKNEERWISACLKSVFRQNYPNLEVILVDNKSTDRTVAKAKQYPVKLVEIEDFKPGLAINLGIKASKGDILVCLSGHCVPTDETWLTNLVADLDDPQIAGVYGRQQPLSFSSPFDKRDLMIVFGLDKKVQHKDSFFHNANSAFRREIWQRFPFDNDLSNIEDRLWGKTVIDAGLKIVYEPDASVYHYHGIHQDLDVNRANNVVRIMEEISGAADLGRHAMHKAEVFAIIPVRGKSITGENGPLLKYAIRQAQASPSIDRVIVSTDSEETAELAKSLGAEAPFLRPEHLSDDIVGIGDVLQWTLEEVEQLYGVPDLVVVLGETYPFRPDTLIEDMISLTLDQGFDAVIAGQSESRHIWFRDRDGQIEDSSEPVSTPRNLRDKHALVGLFGLGCVTHPMNIRLGDPLSGRLGIVEVSDPLSRIEVRDQKTMQLTEPMLINWRTANGSENPKP
ncbi:glycosyltransferase [uncultured Roseibium sp.]|uniref:glycosyltransferase n=1 Tax=uncultured Roseibium sp. TaxID=1936171 RepID=UPI0026258B12|nr:glycosyltransferase [uncultured Roseibium sp.]